MSDTAAGKGPEAQVTLAAVIGAHGIKGEVRLKLFGESVESLRRYQAVNVDGRPMTLVAVKGDRTPTARFAEVSDRTQAEALRGSLVSVPRSALPPLGEGEYYHVDIIGLECVGPEGEILGQVKTVENFGAGDILEILRPDGKTVMISFKPGIADLKDGRILVDPLYLA
jgi:16S rRNA processing protein RimM